MFCFLSIFFFLGFALIQRHWPLPNRLLKAADGQTGARCPRSLRAQRPGRRGSGPWAPQRQQPGRNKLNFQVQDFFHGRPYSTPQYPLSTPRAYVLRDRLEANSNSTPRWRVSAASAASPPLPPPQMDAYKPLQYKLSVWHVGDMLCVQPGRAPGSSSRLASRTSAPVAEFGTSFPDNASTHEVPSEMLLSMQLGRESWLGRSMGAHVCKPGPPGPCQCGKGRSTVRSSNRPPFGPIGPGGPATRALLGWGRAGRPRAQSRTKAPALRCVLPDARAAGLGVRRTHHLNVTLKLASPTIASLSPLSQE